jgi:hypothetical protein
VNYSTNTKWKIFIQRWYLNVIFWQRYHFKVSCVISTLYNTCVCFSRLEQMFLSPTCQLTQSKWSLEMTIIVVWFWRYSHFLYYEIISKFYKNIFRADFKYHTFFIYVERKYFCSIIMYVKYLLIMYVNRINSIVKIIRM